MLDHQYRIPIDITWLMSKTMPSSVLTATTTPSVAHTAAMNPSCQEQASTSTGETDGDYNKFFWTYTEEPHRTRRQAIIKAHPEVWRVE